MWFLCLARIFNFFEPISLIEKQIICKKIFNVYSVYLSITIRLIRKFMVQIPFNFDKSTAVWWFKIIDISKKNILHIVFRHVKINDMSILEFWLKNIINLGTVSIEKVDISILH